MSGIRKKSVIFALILIFIFIIILFGNKIRPKTVVSDNPVGQIKKVSANNVVQNDKIEKMRFQRNNDRREIISKLSDTVNNAAADEISRQDASKKINEIYDNSLKESLCEDLIKLKGYKNALVYINLNSVDVFVCSENMSENDIIIIHDIILNKTSINNIKIVAVE